MLRLGLFVICTALLYGAFWFGTNFIAPEWAVGAVVFGCGGWFASSVIHGIISARASPPTV